MTFEILVRFSDGTERTLVGESGNAWQAYLKACAVAEKIDPDFKVITIKGRK